VSLPPALFLDRDGVINVDHGYVVAREDFEFIEGIFELCRQAKALGYLIVVVTNQAAIGRGLTSEEAFKFLTEWMCGVFRAEGAEIDGIYVSPYHSEHGRGAYKIDSPLRKPAPGMILKARDELGIDLPASVLIGDKETDIQAGKAAGVGCNLLYSGSTEEPIPATEAAAVISRLANAVPFLRRASCKADP
jgi:D-glycero-D-manno-heptose 1,7-bisphosphate phosphatase